MAGLSSKGELNVLNSLLTTRFLSLHTADPGDGGASEVTTVGSAYARQSVPFTNTGANPTIAQNNALVQFATATAGWGTLTHVGIWDAATGGNFLMSATINTPKAVLTGDVVRFLANSILVGTN